MPRKYSMAKRADASGRTRTGIEMALIRLLATKPYGAITVADIAGEADVSVRTIQRHYPSKGELLAASCRYSLKWTDEELSKRRPARSADEAIRLFVEAQFDFYRHHDAECWAVYSLARDVPEVQEALRATAEAWAAPIEGLIALWQEAWAVDRQSAKRAVDALVSYPAWRALTDFDRFNNPEAATFITEVLCRSLLRDYPPTAT